MKTIRFWVYQLGRGRAIDRSIEQLMHRASYFSRPKASICCSIRQVSGYTSKIDRGGGSAQKSGIMIELSYVLISNEGNIAVASKPWSSVNMRLWKENLGNRLLSPY